MTWLIMVGITFATAGLLCMFEKAALWFERNLERMPIIRNLVLNMKESRGTAQESLSTAVNSVELVEVGDSGTVLTTLRPSGKAKIRERVVDVVSDSGMISQGAKVRVIEVDGFKVVVEAFTGG